ncbi:mannosyltransferase [Nocardia stercoris]|uniref:mannosyltransferase n=1 Tax=Nocardia stercoris TaxID=2483361 RepID=UPI001F33C380|nr:mannosyltransferase [Nocardia stercoris]
MTRHLRWARSALALSVLIRLVWMLATPDGMNVVDLRVYVFGSANLGSGSLYDFTYSDKTPDFPLPFTYPPFAAVLFYPMHFLPFTLVAVGWLLLIVAALYGVVRLTQRMLLGGGADEQSAKTGAVWWTAIGMWMEPVRVTIDYGQVNVFLVLAVMVAATTSRKWLPGLLIGLAAGVKLTPAVTGLYFLARKRWASAVWSAVVFGGTVIVCLLISPGETRTYFGPLIGDAHRIGPVGSVENQSVRGALTRLLGYDAGEAWTLHGHRIPWGPWWLAGVVVVTVLAYFAWRALGPDDDLGTLLVVQLFGLMVSPISWAHHFVWLLPLILWLRHGPWRDRPGARQLYWAWLVVSLVGVPWVLLSFQPTIWTISRPGVLSWLGAVYVLGTLFTFGWLIRTGRRSAVRELHPVG